MNGDPPIPNFHEAVTTAQALETSVKSAIRGKDAIIQKSLACMISGGHLLLQDQPGTGKTTLAKAIAHSIEQVSFKRVQFTPDLLPSDILGVSIFNPKDQQFHFHHGPIFTNILLADEINRASPRTQSALLEAMGERQATIDGTTYDLDPLFFVIATQNPIEFRGTYPLPEAQMDRFSMQCSLGYVSAADESLILSTHSHSDPVDHITPCVSSHAMRSLMRTCHDVRLTEDLRNYIVALIRATRSHPMVQLPASPRASLALMKVSQAFALIQGLEFVTPELIQSLVIEVVAHRLSLIPEAKFNGITPHSVMEQIIDQTPVPV